MQMTGSNGQVQQHMRFSKALVNCVLGIRAVSGSSYMYIIVIVAVAIVVTVILCQQ